MRLLVTPSDSPLRGIVPGPIDSAAATYALVIAALAEGCESVLEGRGVPELGIALALRSLGVAIESMTDQAGRRHGFRVRGTGLSGMRAPGRELDAGRSPAAMASLAAIGASLPFATCLIGDPDVMRRVMAPIARVLRMRGGTIEGQPVLEEVTGAGRPRAGKMGPPFALGPSDIPLSPLNYELGETEAWPDMRDLAKATALLSGIDAEGATQLFERIVSHDVLERMLTAAGAPIQSLGPMLELEGPVRLRGLCGPLPADANFSAAILGAALQRPGSHVGVRRLPTRPTALGWLEALADAGARLNVEAKHDALGLPAADVTLSSGLARGLALGGERAHRVGVSIPVLASLAARAPRGAHSQLFDLPTFGDFDPRALQSLLERFGASCTVQSEGLVVGGIVVGGIGQEFSQEIHIDCRGDADLALAALMLAVGTPRSTTIDGLGDLVDSFPRIAATFRALGVDVVVLDASRTSEATATETL